MTCILSDRVYDWTDGWAMSDCAAHVKWKDLADELMRQDSRLLGRGITVYNFYATAHYRGRADPAVWADRLPKC